MSWVPGSILIVLRVFFSFALHTECDDFLHFTDEEYETWRGQIIYLGSHSQRMTQQDSVAETPSCLPSIHSLRLPEPMEPCIADCSSWPTYKTTSTSLLKEIQVEVIGWGFQGSSLKRTQLHKISFCLYHIPPPFYQGQGCVTHSSHYGPRAYLENETHALRIMEQKVRWNLSSQQQSHHLRF